MGDYEDLVLRTVEAVMPAGRPMQLGELTLLVLRRFKAHSKDIRWPVPDAMQMTAVMRSSPRLVEIAPGVWMRRDDRPDAGMPSRPGRPPVAGSAAAEAPLPKPHVRLDVSGGEGGKVTLETAGP